MNWYAARSQNVFILALTSQGTTLHYGKRGMSYHGAAVIYCKHDGSKGIKYFDVIVSGDAKQDAPATLAMVISSLCLIF